jgi:transposase-like protein
VKLKTSILKDNATIETCPDGAMHDLTYQGSEAQHYRCKRCGSRITKEDLKEATDNA